MSVGLSSVLGIVAAHAAAEVRGEDGGVMQIDCDRCTARGPGCGDCVVAVILGEPPAGTGLEHTGFEHSAHDVTAHGRARLDRGRFDQAHLDQAHLDHADLDDDDWAALQVLADSGLVSARRLGTPALRSPDRDVRRA